jgi:autotransporter-associated beta strand protein
LKANVGSAYFIQPYVNAVVQSGGAIIDDGGFSVQVLAPLVDGGGGGGLTKLDTGALFLMGTNTYTGLTTVSAGALGLGVGASIAGPVTVHSSAILLGDAGTIGTSAINNTLTLQAGSTTGMQITPTSNDQITGLTGVTYGGALVVSNSSASPLTSGATYQLFNCAVPGSGNFSSVTLLPVGTATFNPATGVLTIGAVTPPTVNTPVLVNGNMIVTGGGGTPGGGYTLLSTTNVATPLAQWITNTTGTFNASGNFSNSIPVPSNPAEQFFKLRTP